MIRYNGPLEDELSDEQRRIRNDILISRPNTGLSGPFGPWLSIPAVAQPAQLLGVAVRYNCCSLYQWEVEIIILLTATKYNSYTEFNIHKAEALRVGVPIEFIEAIPFNKKMSESYSSNNTDSSSSNTNNSDSNDILLFDKENIEIIIQLLLSKLQVTRTVEQYQREKVIIEFTIELLIHSHVLDITYNNALEVLQSTRRKVEEDVVNHNNSNPHAVIVEITSIIGYYSFVAYTLNVFRIPPPSSSPPQLPSSSPETPSL